MFCLLVLTQPRHDMAKRIVLGIEEASFSMPVHRLHMFTLLGERAVGPRRCWRMGRSSKGGGRRCRRLCGVGLSCVCFSCGLAWLRLLACVLGWYKCVCVVGWSLGWGVVGLRDGLCWATRRCTCQGVRGGIAHTRRRSCLKCLFPFH